MRLALTRGALPAAPVGAGRALRRRPRALRLVSQHFPPRACRGAVPARSGQSRDALLRGDDADGGARQDRPARGARGGTGQVAHPRRARISALGTRLGAHQVACVEHDMTLRCEVRGGGYSTALMYRVMFC
jgi:hypothetical protein